MPQRKKIDTTLQERHGILHLLERLKQESITLDEMEEIGVKLKKSGKRANGRVFGSSASTAMKGSSPILISMSVTGWDDMG